MTRFHTLRLTVGALAFTIPFSLHAQTNNISGNQFNPAISLILDGYYADYQDDFELPGFQTGGEAGLPEQGFGLGHSELSISANIDDRFYGSATIALHEHEGATETELEEAFIETVGFGNGITFKGGKFFSGLGYMNGQHEHAWDFATAPLVYAALFGNKLVDQGVQARWLAPLDFYLELGAEITRGDSFPGGENSGNQGQVLFAKTGADLSANTSWQLGLSGYRTRFDERAGGDHGHEGEGEEHSAELLMNDGEVSIVGMDAVFKWAPTGNSRERQLVLQAEYFQRDENAALNFTEADSSVLADYDGKQSGYYAQAVYRFMPGWRIGARYDAIKADNDLVEVAADGIDLEEFLEDTGFDNRDTITRETWMLDYSHSEFSRIRFQYSYFDLPGNRDELFMIQYTMSLGSHGAHRY
jgi:hypothetical protein